jgi:regulator of replication initiation timing
VCRAELHITTMNSKTGPGSKSWLKGLGSSLHGVRHGSSTSTSTGTQKNANCSNKIEAPSNGNNSRSRSSINNNKSNKTSKIRKSGLAASMHDAKKVFNQSLHGKKKSLSCSLHGAKTSLSQSLHGAKQATLDLSYHGYQTQREHTKAELRLVKVTLEGYKEENEELLGEAQVLVEENEHLQKELMKTRTKCKTVKEEKKMLTKELLEEAQSLVFENEHLQKELTKTRTKCKTVKEEKEMLTKQLAIEGYKEENEELLEEAQVLVFENEHLQKKLMETRTACKTIKEEKKMLAKQLEETQFKLECYELAHQDQKNNRRPITDTLASIAGENSSSRLTADASFLRRTRERLGSDQGSDELIGHSSDLGEEGTNADMSRSSVLTFLDRAGLITRLQ